MNQTVSFRLVCALAAVSLGALFFSACAGRSPVPPAKSRPEVPGAPRPYKVLGKWYQPLPHARGFQQKGIASWYGKKFHGRKTSSGETYDMYAESAAHKTLPLGTYVRVHNLENHKKIDVRINDRGPFVRGRIIDLSYAAARKIGMVDAGTAAVEIIALGYPVPPGPASAARSDYMPVDFYAGEFTIQIGAFANPGNAEKLKRKLSRTYQNVHIFTDRNEKKAPFKVRVGRCSTLDQAAGFEAALIEKGFRDAFVIAE